MSMDIFFIANIHKYENTYYRSNDNINRSMLFVQMDTSFKAGTGKCMHLYQELTMVGRYL